MKSLMILGGVVLVAGWAAGTSALAQPGEADGVLSLTPVQARSCVAVTIPVSEGEALAGVRWFNNDGSVPFVRVWACAGWPEVAPSSIGSVELAAGVSGGTLAWSTVAFGQPVASSTGFVQVVFQLPPFAEPEVEGLGGGPGIGYHTGVGNGWLTADGEFWIGLGEDCALLCEPVLTARTTDTFVMFPAQCREGRFEDRAPPSSDDAPRPVTALAAPYPNPFNPQVNVAFTLARAQRVVVNAYDVQGRLVRKVWDRHTSAGPHVVAWDGTDEAGRRQASGVYLVGMVSPQLRCVRRVTLLK